MLNGDHRLNVEPKRRPTGPSMRGNSMNRPMGGMNTGQSRGGGRPGGSMGMGGPPRDGSGGRGGMSGGRGGGGGGGGYVTRRQ